MSNYITFKGKRLGELTPEEINEYRQENVGDFSGAFREMIRTTLVRMQLGDLPIDKGMLNTLDSFLEWIKYYENTYGGKNED